MASSKKDLPAPTQLELWTVQPVDPLTGKRLSRSERARRERVRQEALEGLMAMDTTYTTHQAAIHQPLGGEHGVVAEGYWELRRSNHVTLRVRVGETDAAERLEQAALSLVRNMLDDDAAEVMRVLFMLSNRPPYWRRNEFSVRTSELMDHLGWKRDARGVHRSDNRQKLCRTLLALTFTRINVETRRDGQRVGFFASLLSGVGYMFPDDDSDISSSDAFSKGLPEELVIAINPWWHRKLDDPEAIPGQDYALVPMPEPSTGRRARSGARTPRAVDPLRSYLQGLRRDAEGTPVQVTRAVLLQTAGITNKNPSQANRTLSSALDTLCDEGILASCTRPLPLMDSALVTLRWTHD